jgi:heat shock protein HslJ
LKTEVIEQSIEEKLMRKMKYALSARLFHGGLCFAVMMAGLVLSACAGGAAVKETALNFDDVRGKEWILTELRTGSAVIRLDRQKLEAEDLGDVYTLRFDEDRLSGKGAPNRYFGPYELGDGGRLTLSRVASTEMMGIKEPEELKEYEYYDYLNRVNRWGMAQGRLELFSETPDGREAVLVFSGE